MSKYRIIVADAEKAHAALVRSYHLHPHRQREIRQQPPRPVGTLHTEMDSECPEGRPNCRDCGDPTHAEACQAAGHCPHCGTRHGIAPDRVLVDNGLRLEAAD